MQEQQNNNCQKNNNHQPQTSNKYHANHPVTPQLPNEYLHYQAPFRLLNESKSLFKALFFQWKTCLMCILKIYCIEYPKMYSDNQFLAFMLKKLLLPQSLTQKSCQKLTQQQFFKNYNHSQKIYNRQHCWLCEQLMQKSYVNNLKESILQKIKNNNYGIYQKYKLNIRVPLIFTLKYYLICIYLWHKFAQNSGKNTNNQNLQQQTIVEEQEQNIYKVSQNQLAVIQRILKQPYQKLTPKSSSNPILQVKVVQKWLISYQINTQTPLQSTIQQLDDMLTINIQHEYHNQYVQNNIMNLFSHLVGLEKKSKSKAQRLHEQGIKSNPHKKVKIDLTGMNGQNEDNKDEQNNQNQAKQQQQKTKNDSFKCIVNNVNKILWLKYDQMKHILIRISSEQQLRNILQPKQSIQIHNHKLQFVNSTKSISRTIKLQTKNIIFSGKYCKYSRYISQTPWIVNGVKLTQGSLQQQIEDQILHYFYPTIKKQNIQTKFHSGGREDIDVRMLKGGRPFALELVNPIYRLKDLNLQKIIEGTNLSIQTKKKIYQQVSVLQNQKDKIMLALQNIVNFSTQLVQIKDFKQANQTYISVDLKKAQIQKIKHYVCYIVSEQQLTEKDREIVDSSQELELDQKTPLRVLHRRTLMIRKKYIHKMYMHLVTKYSAIVEIWASAGTYIKEFVHGDVQRTVPNLGSLIGKKVDILQLDVGSLKQGTWEKGDDQKMRFDSFEWKN